jgi:hypothetical protein
MIQSAVQRRKVHAQTIWRAIVTGLVILFLSVPPAWAAIFCHCASAMASQHVCCQTKASSGVSENSHHSPEREKKASHCQSAPASSVDFQVRKSAQDAITCCEATSPREVENAEVSFAPTVGAEEPPPLSAAYQQRLSQALQIIHNLPRQPQRPLYLALSCWLI